MQEKVIIEIKFHVFNYDKPTNIDSNQITLFSSSRIGERVMRKLADIASFAVKKTGIFHNSQTRPVEENIISKGKNHMYYVIVVKVNISI